MTRGARRALTFLGVSATLLVTLAAPAGAHSTSGPPASNFHTVVGGLRAAVPGVDARLGPDGERIELHVGDRVRITVLGYQGEPYLRVGRTGVFENRSSPAVALNRTRVPSGAAPQGPIRPPHWVRVSTGSTARWHDHRAHWMGGATPDPLRRDPEPAHVIGRWRIPLRVDGGSVDGAAARGDAAIVGTIRWDPPPDARLWFALAAALLVLVLAATRVAARPVLLTALAVLATAEAVHLWGSWPYSTASSLGRVGENLPSLAAVAAALVALVWLARRSLYAAAPLLIIAGLFTAVAGGFADLPVLSHAWIPSRLDPTLARTLVAIALGVGLAVALAGVAHLRRSPTGTGERGDPAPPTVNS